MKIVSPLSFFNLHKNTINVKMISRQKWNKNKIYERKFKKINNAYASIFFFVSIFSKEKYRIVSCGRNRCVVCCFLLSVNHCSYDEFCEWNCNCWRFIFNFQWNEWVNLLNNRKNAVVLDWNCNNRSIILYTKFSLNIHQNH